MINSTSVYRAAYSQDHVRHSDTPKRQSLIMLILLSITMISMMGCGWLLKDPPLYPDQGVGGAEERSEDNNTDVTMDEDLGENEQEMPLLDQMSGGE